MNFFLGFIILINMILYQLVFPLASSPLDVLVQFSNFFKTNVFKLFQYCRKNISAKWCILTCVKRNKNLHPLSWNDILKNYESSEACFDLTFNELNMAILPSIENAQKNLKTLQLKHNFFKALLKITTSALSSEDQATANAMLEEQRIKLCVICERLQIENFSKHFFAPTSSNESATESKEIKTVQKNKAFLSNHSSVPINPTNESTYCYTSTESFQFLNTAVGLICDFDGQFKNLRKFLDTIDLISLIKGPHEILAAYLIKTKVTGFVSNLIANESSLESIKQILIKNIRGESVMSLTRKLQHAKRYSKNVNTYGTYVRKISYLLKNALIIDGFDSKSAEEYTIKTAINSIAQNTKCENIKTLMKKSKFSSIEDLINKFLESSYEKEIMWKNIYKKEIS